MPSSRGYFDRHFPPVDRPWLCFGFVAVGTRQGWLSFGAEEGARMVARKKTKTVPKAKAAARTKSKATTSSAGTIRRKAKSPSQPEAGSKPAAKAKPKAATLPRSKTPTKSKPTQAATSPEPAVSAPRPTTPAPSNPRASAPSGFQVEGTNGRAPFTLKLHRGEGMTLVAMNWKNGQPPQDRVSGTRR